MRLTMSSSTRKPSCLKSELLAHRALGSAADVVVARGGKSTSSRSSSARRPRDYRRSQLEV
jgi:hypothetical protein